MARTLLAVSLLIWISRRLLMEAGVLSSVFHQVTDLKRCIPLANALRRLLEGSIVLQREVRYPVAGSLLIAAHVQPVKFVLPEDALVPII